MNFYGHDYDDDGKEIEHDDSDRSSRLDQLRSELLDSPALDKINPPEPLIEGVLYLDSLAWLHGKPGNAKSFVALDWAACVSLGFAWQDRPVIQGPVLYVIAEGVTGLRQRVRAWEDNAGQMVAILFLPVAIQLMHPIDLEAVALLAGELNPVLIVVDTQARTTMGADENSAKDMGNLVAAVDRLRHQTRACVLLVHHESRNGESMRGSTALEGAATTVVRVSKEGSRLRLDNTKQKDAVPFDPMKLRLVPHGESAIIRSPDGLGLDDEMSRAETQLLEIMRDAVGTDGMSPSALKELAAESKMSRSQYYRALKSLLRRGDVVNLGSEKRARYALRSNGQSQVPEQSQSSPAFSPSPSPTSHHPFRGGTDGTDGREAGTSEPEDEFDPPF